MRKVRDPIFSPVLIGQRQIRLGQVDPSAFLVGFPRLPPFPQRGVNLRFLREQRGELCLQARLPLLQVLDVLTGAFHPSPGVTAAPLGAAWLATGFTHSRTPPLCSASDREVPLQRPVSVTRPAASSPRSCSGPRAGTGTERG